MIGEVIALNVDEVETAPYAQNEKSVEKGV